LRSISIFAIARRNPGYIADCNYGKGIDTRHTMCDMYICSVRARENQNVFAAFPFIMNLFISFL